MPITTANPITRFLITCSGTTRAILTEKGCEIEHPKYAGIGATILFTAVLAALSGGYAMSTVFHNKWLSIAFGLLWGLIIFNLDRLIVSSIRKTSSNPNVSLSKRFGLKTNEFLKALPRLGLAIFISVVITRPIELKIFESEIQAQITKDLIQERTLIEDAVKTEFADIDNLERVNIDLRNRLIELQNEWNRRVKVASSELEGWGGTHRPGYGSEYKKRQAEAKEAQGAMNAFEARYSPVIQANERTIENRKALRNTRIEEAKLRIDQSSGLLKRLEAFSNLSATHGSVFLASIFILLLFILLETAPLFVKLLSSRGPYDEYLETVEHEAYATREKNVSDVNDRINTEVALSRQGNADRLQAEIRLTQSTLASLQTLIAKEVNEAQVEIAKATLADWKNRQLSHLPSREAARSAVAPSVANTGTGNNNNMPVSAGNSPLSPPIVKQIA